MKRWLYWMLCALVWATSVGAAEKESRVSPKKIRDEVRVVVEGQLAALREEDFATAYDYAALGIKRQFNERVFAAMIRRGYPSLLRHQAFDVGIVRDNSQGEAQVAVTVTDALQRNTYYRYWLVEEEAGWRIAGVVLEQKPARGSI
ncbi:DUF4864 domain-containing protein [Oleiharenicola lentus]|uniref:DUF4864 domain-containing protein n=1 Tax=Oleiharenicola lentus TaxID=2508720 RepID=UPI003F661553